MKLGKFKLMFIVGIYNPKIKWWGCLFVYPFLSQDAFISRLFFGKCFSISFYIDHGARTRLTILKTDTMAGWLAAACCRLIPSFLFCIWTVLETCLIRTTTLNLAQLGLSLSRVRLEISSSSCAQNRYFPGFSSFFSEKAMGGKQNHWNQFRYETCKQPEIERICPVSNIIRQNCGVCSIHANEI